MSGRRIAALIAGAAIVVGLTLLLFPPSVEAGFVRVDCGTPLFGGGDDEPVGCGAARDDRLTWGLVALFPGVLVAIGAAVSGSTTSSQSKN